MRLVLGIAPVEVDRSFQTFPEVTVPLAGLHQRFLPPARQRLAAFGLALSKSLQPVRIMLASRP